MQELIPLPSTLEVLVEIVTNALPSKNSRKVYARHLRGFLAFAATRANRFDRALLQEYKTLLLREGKCSSSINQAICAIKKLAQEASEMELMSPSITMGISRVPGVPTRGVRMGRWLTLEQLRQLLALPDTLTPIGRRDLVMLGLLALAGCRQEEATLITAEHLQTRNGRLIIVDLVGKGNRVRSIPLHPVLVRAIEEWQVFDGVTFGPLLRDVVGGTPRYKGISVEGVRWTVAKYSKMMGVPFSSHDLRRTFAQCARKAGGRIDQIQATLGHSSVATTERYLGTSIDLEHPACDSIVFD